MVFTYKALKLVLFCCNNGTIHFYCLISTLRRSINTTRHFNTRISKMVQSEKKWVDSMLCNYVIAVISASNSELVTFPLDLIKTRLQVQGELAAAKEGVSTAAHKGMIKTGLEIVEGEGVLKLWHGIIPAICRHCIYSGVRMSTYQKLREHVLTPDPNGYYPLWKSSLNAASSGIIGQFLANPPDLVKVQMQMEGKRKLLGLPPRVTSPLQAFKTIYATGGIKGLWNGVIPSMQRAAMVNLGDLAGYDVSKRFLLSFDAFTDNVVTHTLASIAAGFIAAVLTIPFDTLKTRLMNQPTDKDGKGLLYKNTTDCFVQTVKNEGVFALYKGFLPLWIRLGPWAFVFWISYENLKKLVGATPF